MSNDSDAGLGLRGLARMSSIPSAFALSPPVDPTPTNHA
jgi:hypothetical protein